MYKLLFLILFFVNPFLPYRTEEPAEAIVTSGASECEQLFDEMQLDTIVNYKAFEQAYSGYKKIDSGNKDVLTLIDFSLPSTEKRLFVLDMKQHKVLYSSYVSHGRRSGGLYANSFSNKVGSNKSSLGFYVTGDTYQGENGYSLQLEGLEKGINDKARARAIVIHGAWYCSQNLVDSGQLGRSRGCPAVPSELNRPIIDAIKDGTVLYIYADNALYAKTSKILKQQASLAS